MEFLRKYLGKFGEIRGICSGILRNSVESGILPGKWQREREIYLASRGVLRGGLSGGYSGLIWYRVWGWGCLVKLFVAGRVVFMVPLSGGVGVIYTDIGGVLASSGRFTL